MKIVTEYLKTEILFLGNYTMITGRQKTGKRGIIQRMKETWRMWQMIVYIKKNQPFLRVLDNEKHFDQNDNPLEKEVNKMLSILNQTRETRMIRAMITAHYFNSKKPSTEKITKDEIEGRQKITNSFSNDALERINNCLDKSVGFLISDADNVSLVYLPLKGQKFGTIMGLLKEWGEDVGELLSAWKIVIVTFAGTLPCLILIGFLRKQ